MKLTEKEKYIAQRMPKYVLPEHDVGFSLTTIKEVDWDADLNRVVPTGQYILQQWALDGFLRDQFCRQEYLTPFDTKAEAEIAAAKLNILGLHEIIMAAHTAISGYTAQLISAYRAQGMSMADAQRLVEDCFDDAGDVGGRKDG